MEITEVRIKLMEIPSERLQAFCSITFDDSFVIRDLKIIEGASGPFVAMPSRKLTGHCPQCGSKNHLRASYCNQCGGRLADDRAARDEEGRAKLYADIAHPINSACREMIQERVIREFRVEVERSKLPGYVSRYEDLDEEIRLAAHPAHGGAPTPHHRPAGANQPSRRPAAQRAQPPVHAPTESAIRSDSAIRPENVARRDDVVDDRHPRGPIGPPAPGASASLGSPSEIKPSVTYGAVQSPSGLGGDSISSGRVSDASPPTLGPASGRMSSMPARKEDAFGAGIF
jgi:stage V sporulation protein G